MRDARHGKDGARCLRCAETNALCRRPAIVSLAPPAPPPITKWRTAIWRLGGLVSLRSGRPDRSGPIVPRALEIRIYLTKVREWTKASCKPFAASIAL